MLDGEKHAMIYSTCKNASAHPADECRCEAEGNLWAEGRALIKQKIRYLGHVKCQDCKFHVEHAVDPHFQRESKHT